MRGTLLAGVLATMLSGGFAGSALAQACEEDIALSPESRTRGVIHFWNTTDYAYKVLWSDFDGGLKSYGWVQPGEGMDMRTFAGHQWWVEVDSVYGEYCVGPMSLSGAGECNISIKQFAPDDFRIDAGGDCDM